MADDEDLAELMHRVQHSRDARWYWRLRNAVLRGLLARGHSRREAARLVAEAIFVARWLRVSPSRCCGLHATTVLVRN